MTVVFQARPGQEDALGAALNAMVAPSRADDGCLFYDLYRSIGNPTEFLFQEGWESQAHHDAHDRTPHVVKLKSRLSDLSLPPVVRKWTQADVVS